jgi:hypothetical protein
MLNIIVNETEYKCFANWDDMTIGQGIELSKVAQQIPETLKAIYKEMQSGTNTPEYKALIESISVEDRLKSFPAFYGKILKVMTTIPEDVIDHIDTASRIIFYQTYCQDFVFSVLFHVINFTPKNIDHFEFNGVKYNLPETKIILGHEKPMANASALEFAEVADLQVFAHNMQGGKIEVAPNIISILCRPSGERYNEATCLERAKEFKELSMSIFWEVFFCLTELLTISRQRTAISLLEVQLNKQRQEREVASQN